MTPQEINEAICEHEWGPPRILRIVTNVGFQYGIDCLKCGLTKDIKGMGYGNV
jgi:hypothetical protein